MNDVSFVQKRLKGLLLKRPGFAMLLNGPAGIGKTFTINRLLLESTCRHVSVHATASPSTLVKTLPASNLPTWAAGILEQVSNGETFEPDQLVSALGVLLGKLAPFVLHVEDVHEATPQQAAFAQQLAHVVTRQKGVALLVTSRNVALEGLEAILIEPLGFDEVKTMLEREAVGALPSEGLEWIHGKAAGNPLFALEFFRHLARQGVVWNDGQRWNWRTPQLAFMPVTVEAIIERSIADACSQASTLAALEARAYLETFGLGSAVTDEVWAKVADLEPSALSKATTALESHGVWRADATPMAGFVHPLFREVPFQALTASRRVVLAKRVLDHLPIELAAPCIVDAQLGAERSCELLVRVARSAAEPGPWLALATDFAVGEERTELALEAARELKHQDISRARALFELALQDNADVTLKLEFVEFCSRNDFSERATAILNALPQDVLDSPQGQTTQVLMLNDQGDYSGVVAFWRSLDSRNDLDPDLLVHVIYSLKTLGQFDNALDLADATLVRSNLTAWQRARVLNRKYSTLGETDRYDDALELVEYLLAWLETHHLPGRAIILGDRAMYRHIQGKYHDAKQDLLEALEFAVQSGQLLQGMKNRAFLGSICTEHGQYQEAEDLLLAAFHHQHQLPPSLHLMDNLHNLIELYASWTDHPSRGLLAQRYARHAIKYAETIGSPAYQAGALSYAAIAEIAAGHPKRALELTCQAKDLRVQGDDFFGFWLPNWFEAKARMNLGQHQQAEQLLEGVVGKFAEWNRVFDFHRASLDLCFVRNDPAAAQEHLNWFQERGLNNAYWAGLQLFPSSTEQPKPTALPAAKLEVLGPMQLNTNGQTQTVRGQKRQALLAALLETRLAARNEIGKLELIDRLYPESDETQAVNALQETVRSTRASFGSNIIQTTNNGYALGEIGSDAETFLRSLDTQLWRGPYLNGLEGQPDSTAQDTLHAALFEAAQKLLESNPNETARVGQLLLESDPYRQDYLRLTLQALRANDNHKSLKRLYGEARERLQELGEHLPERWQDFLDGTPD